MKTETHFLGSFDERRDTTNLVELFQGCYPELSENIRFIIVHRKERQGQLEYELSAQFDCDCDIAVGTYKLALAYFTGAMHKEDTRTFLRLIKRKQKNDAQASIEKHAEDLMNRRFGL